MFSGVFCVVFSHAEPSLAHQRRPDYKEGVEFDNLGETLLEPKLFNQTKGIGQKPFMEINKITTEDTLDSHLIFHIRATRWEGVTMIDEDLKKRIIEENKKDE